MWINNLITINRQAIKTSLADIKPVDGEWSDDCLAVMAEQLKDPKPYVFSYEKTGDTFTVCFITSTGISVAALLVAKGFATSTGSRYHFLDKTYFWKQISTTLLVEFSTCDKIKQCILEIEFRWKSSGFLWIWLTRLFSIDYKVVLRSVVFLFCLQPKIINCTQENINFFFQQNRVFSIETCFCVQIFQSMVVVARDPRVIGSDEFGSVAFQTLNKKIWYLRYELNYLLN